MAFKKNDKVIVITKDGDNYVTEIDEVSSVSGGQVSLLKKSDKFKPTGKHQSKNDSAIVPIEEYSQSTFVKSGTVKGISISKEKAEKLLRDAK